MVKFEEGGEQMLEFVESFRIGVWDFVVEFIEKFGGLFEKSCVGPSEEVVKIVSDVMDKY